MHPQAERIVMPELREISWGIWEGKRSPDLSELSEAWLAGDYEGRSMARMEMADATSTLCL